eukprot:c23061_g1_i1.p1 GENE.c23061_g1_i1~~c23061_g1_i1.p1  ORF type:complete len:303 (-),score=81.71 c23061_g1_i1:90-938(-)
MARLDNDNDKLLPQQAEKAYLRKLLIAFSVCALAIILFVAILAAYTNVDESVCGDVALPTSFILAPRGITVRSDVDVFENAGNFTKGPRVGEFYKKLLSMHAIYRFVDQHNNIAATMEKTSVDENTVTVCETSTTKFSVKLEEFLVGVCGDSHTWNTKFSVLRQEGDEPEEVIVSSTLQDSRESSFQLTSQSGASAGTIEITDSQWNVVVKDTNAIPPFVAGFLALNIHNAPKTFDCTIPTSSPSVTPSITPSPSPSPSSASALSYLLALVAPLTAVLLALF